MSNSNPVPDPGVSSQYGPSKSLAFHMLHKSALPTRLDLFPLPFTFSALYYYFGSDIFNSEHILAVTCLMLLISFHLLIFFLNFWSVNANIFICYKKLPMTSIESATHVKVKMENKKQHTVRRYIVPLLSNSVLTQSGHINKTYFIDLNKKKLLFASEKKTFLPIPYPISESIGLYQEAEGLRNDQEEKKAALVWGPNKIDIPIPKFMDIYKEHLVAPFFVFQLFCSGLWLLDEYWYYSLMTLGMLFMFEGTVVMQRLQNMKRLRGMRVASQEVYAHRFGRWVKIMSDEIYPGEIILIKKNKTEKKSMVPCDLLILSGQAVVNESILTGESQPLVKESIANKDDPDELLDLKGQHRVHILNGGTEILQFIPSEDVAADVPQLHMPPPAQGLICFVVKNGFETKQGKLMRTILFSTERVTVESKETYAYLLILLCFALAASYYVLTEGLKDPDRSRYKLMLRCILIITNVVPPELPMELSMAVNYSIIQLVKKQMFCTEPFRIPFAGKIDICCFDKTGTLTQNDLVIKGVTGVLNSSQSQIDEGKGIIPLNEVINHDRHSLLVLGGCHTIAVADNTLVGDPIEKQAFEGILWKHDGRRTSSSKTSGGAEIRIIQLKRFLFESSLKRMTTIVNVEEGRNQSGGGGEYMVLSKGAPEVIKKYLTSVPSGYDKGYIKYVKNGARVLAMAYKVLPRQSADYYTSIKREEAESNLHFCGFIISECPLKPDTKRVIRELKASNHQVKMITGDNQMTAAYIGTELKFGQFPSTNSASSLFASKALNQKITWLDLEENPVKITSTTEEVRTLATQHMLCINGDILDQLFNFSNVSQIIRYIDIFSRTSPNQKDFIVSQLNKEGFITMMCGDGTNDVGSLKRANIGLAIVNNKEPTKEDKTKKKQMSMFLKPQDLVGLSPQEAQEKQKKHMEEYVKLWGGGANAQGGESGMPDLGDACIAAPFTYKFSSMKSSIKLIQQGRTTLTTTFQMYKILSLNSLISAYTMSALYLDGVKMGDYQATAMGMGISILFLMMSFSTPLKKLEKEKPPSSIFHWSLVSSVSIQFAVHLSVLLFLVRLCEPHIDRVSDESLIPDGEFKPNVKNSVLFLYQWWLQCTVFFVNYSGRPFMQDLSENKKLYNYIRLMFMVAICGIFDFSDIVREYLELVPFPDADFQQKVILVLAADFVVCYVVDRFIKKMYLNTFK